MQRNATTREALADLLRLHPGLTPADASRHLGVDRTTAHYHLRRLVREGRAVTGGEPRALRYFTAGALRPADREVHLAALAARRAAGLLDALRGAPGATQSGLARRLGIPRATLAWRLGKLRRAGLVRAERQGREVRLHVALTPEGSPPSAGGPRHDDGRGPDAKTPSGRGPDGGR